MLITIDRFCFGIGFFLCYHNVRYLNVVSSLWLEYPLELLTCRFGKCCDDFPDFLDENDGGFGFLDKLVGVVSDDDDVSSWASKQDNLIYINFILELYSSKKKKKLKICIKIL